jgi:hypothetical protein
LDSWESGGSKRLSGRLLDNATLTFYARNQVKILIPQP